MFDFNRIIQDLLAKALQMAGTAIAATGYVTDAQNTAIMGGLAAIVGIGLNAYTNRKTRKDVAIVTEAVDDKKTTAAAIDSSKPLALPTDKKNSPSH